MYCTLTKGPLFVEAPLSKAADKLELVILIAVTPTGLEDFHASGQLDVVLVVVAPRSQRQLKLAVKLGQIIQIGAAQCFQPKHTDIQEQDEVVTEEESKTPMTNSPKRGKKHKKKTRLHLHR